MREPNKMIVKVKYLDKAISAYKGREYTYITYLPLKVYDKVLCPVGEGNEMNKAIVTQINLPEDTIQAEWADRVKEIRFYDLPDINDLERGNK